MGCRKLIQLLLHLRQSIFNRRQHTFQIGFLIVKRNDFLLHHLIVRMTQSLLFYLFLLSFNLGQVCNNRVSFSFSLSEHSLGLIDTFLAVVLHVLNSFLNFLFLSFGVFIIFHHIFLYCLYVFVLRSEHFLLSLYCRIIGGRIPANLHFSFLGFQFFFLCFNIWHLSLTLGHELNDLFELSDGCLSMLGLRPFGCFFCHYY